MTLTVTGAIFEIVPPEGTVTDEASSIEFMETLEEALNEEQPDDLEAWLIKRGISFRTPNTEVS